MTEHMESKIIELETLTSLFIKGKEENYGEGFIRIGNTLYFIDNDNLCEFIYKNTYDKDGSRIPNRPDYVEWYSYFISRQRGDDIVTHYKGFAKVFGLDDVNNERDIPEGYKEKSIQFFLSKTRLLQGNNDTQKQVLTEYKIGKGITLLEASTRNGNRFIQNGNKRHYVPGSSLKGAIRNAVLWKILTESSIQAWFLLFLTYHLPVSDFLKKIDENDYEEGEKIISKNAVFQNMNLIRNGHIDRKETKKLKKKYSEHLSGIQDATNSTLESKCFTGKIPYIPISDSDKIDQKKYLQSYNDRWNAANDTLRDFFRLVKVSDGNFVDDFELKGKIAKAVCRDIFGTPPKNKTYQKKFDIKLECAPKTVKVQFKISIDTELVRAFFPYRIPVYLQSVNGLMNVVDEFYREVAKFEALNYYNGVISIPDDLNSNDNRKAKLKVNTEVVYKLYNTIFGLEKNETLFRTGWGGGFMSKTQFLHMDMTDRVRVRDMVHYNGSPLAPKSRCLIIEGQNATEPLGWCKLRVLGDTKDLALPSIDAVKISTDILTEQPRQRGQQRQENRQNKERPVTEKEIHKSKAEAKAILKLVEKQTNLTTQVTYMKGQVVLAKVDECKPFESIKITIGNQSVCVVSGFIKQKGEEVKIKITKIENGKILEAKLL
ncbi:type III-A CRISPR-associated RAMP protein Csm5 [Chlorobium phaeobacteroides]|nr:type III-A CRISPR-associated RAMP protein Csm5 [Chlorobium phaeobacteroides]